ncbi:hypothetical protein K435DRAFT_834223 [Dendrothele bispora CBS 962.96]|uniref:Uncharacterized protein n=1 Tax=Dendrothele bispora (strain CBS 962.96) TaxID=1314807 RepID=A0A4S8MUC9_DENBC|nr:hypothetical protein K435DRAFT_834223 [Dendrothele bispora CBS 962.96]
MASGLQYSYETKDWWHEFHAIGVNVCKTEKVDFDRWDAVFWTKNIQSSTLQFRGRRANGQYLLSEIESSLKRPCVQRYEVPDFVLVEVCSHGKYCRQPFVFYKVNQNNVESKRENCERRSYEQDIRPRNDSKHETLIQVWIHIDVPKVVNIPPQTKNHVGRGSLETNFRHEKLDAWSFEHAVTLATLWQIIDDLV